MKTIAKQSLSISGLTLAIVFSFSDLGSAQAIQLTKASGGGERQPIVTGAGEVLYAALAGTTRELFAVPVDGGTSTKLTTGRDIRLGYGTFDAWPSIASDGTGSKIAFWDAVGVQVLDRTNNTVTTIATAASIPYPRLDAKGTAVVYQVAIQGHFEVFYRSLNATSSVQITSSSGEGRRFPDIYLGRIVYQKPVSGAHELFLYDLTTKTERQLTQNSGLGNRYGRFADDGTAIVYERTTTNDTREAWIVDVTSSVARALTTFGTIGERLGAPTRDGYVFVQAWKRTYGITRVDSTGKEPDATIASGTTGGYRRPAADDHGHVVVYQDLDPATGMLEVWRARSCPSLDMSRYGTSGTPSVGTIGKDFESWYRCELTMGRESTVPSGRVAVLWIGGTQLSVNLGAIAPGNFLYADPIILLPTTIATNGDFDVGLLIPPAFAGTVYSQWGVLDKNANTLGIVTSSATKSTYR
ncbi:MAG: hypothetical protein H6832_05040 [Planctomycetes bacterium]|nr:hypothetical protein [Planctomycetota bacterium]MCB9890505.1 hypothetical protein [Planctomycetota bacterium]MCB9917746.1 hypothetical protein [Planctomycetota bacterium]